MKKALSLQETAHQLGVSQATVLNWEKHGYLKGIRVNSALFYHPAEIKNLKEKIDTGIINRLTSRANKKNSSKTFIPEEYSDNSVARGDLEQIHQLILEYKLKTNESIFTICLKMLIQLNLLENESFSALLKHYNKRSRNTNLIQELNKWQTYLNFERKIPFYEQLFDLRVPDTSDPLGLIYQSIRSEGDKSKNGIYYTPKFICNEMAAEYLNQIRGNVKILDLCCGTGQFLLSAGEHIKKLGRLLKPTCLWGYDIDPIAVQIARINLMILFRDFDFNPNIYQRNYIYNYSLDDKLRKYRKFDLILGNPPWGAEFRQEQLSFLKEHYPEILSMESYSYFIFIGLNLLKEGGYLSYLLPDSVLNIKTHKDIRAYILKNAQIKKIKNYNRIFSNVFSQVVRIDLQKSEPTPFSLTRVEIENEHIINSVRFLKNDEFIFDIYNSDQDIDILEKIFAYPHFKLAGHADWILGIVTGNNKKYLSPVRKKGYLKILKGIDIQAFRIKPASYYIAFNPEVLQQTSPLHKFMAREKLIYRFISNKLVFACDTQQHLTLNSANALIPKLDNYPAKLITCLFNSELYQFIFRRKYFTHKILRSHLENLPLPKLNSQFVNEFINLHDKLELAALDKDLFKIRFEELNQLVYRIFNLTDEEISHIRKRLS